MNNTTEIVFVIDKSGSMSSTVSDTVGGFNSLIEKQKEVDGEVLVTTVLFSDKTKTLHDRLPIKDVKPLTKKDYTPCGCTALLDAIGETITTLDKRRIDIKEEEVPAHTIFFITTDGLENASREFSSKNIKDMITAHEKENKWEFVFVAANIDAVETAGSIGISRDRAADFETEDGGMISFFACASEMVSSVRCNKAISKDWADKLKKK